MCSKKSFLLKNSNTKIRGMLHYSGNIFNSKRLLLRLGFSQFLLLNIL